MKSSLLKMTLALSVLALTPSTWAGVTKFNSAEFNEMIGESMKAEAELRNELRSASGVPKYKEAANPDFAERGRRIVGVVPAEDRVAPTTDHRPSDKDLTRKQLMERSMKRVSQEIETSPR